MFSDLLAMSSDELRAEARAVRDEAHGTRITFSPKVFIPLTMLCRDRCGYCTFAQPPARLEIALPVRPRRCSPSPGPAPRPAATRRCSPSASAPRSATRLARQWLDDHGYDSTVDYLAAMCRAGARRDRPAAARQRRRARRRRARRASALVAAIQGMMIESTQPRPRVPPRQPRQDPRASPGHPRGGRRAGHPLHHRDPGRHRRVRGRPARRPCDAIAASHRRHGHVQEVIVQNFLPKPGTSMHQQPAVPARRATSGPSPLARLVLPPEIHLQAPPNLSDDFGVAARRRHRRLGRRLPGHRRPRQPRAALARAASGSARPPRPAGFTLAPRLTLYPSFALGTRALARPGLRFPVLDRSDAEGLGRDDPGAYFPEQVAAAIDAGDGAEVILIGRRDTAWYSGAAVEPRRARAAAAPGPGARSARCWPACSRARRWARTRSSPCSAPAAPRSPPSPRWPTSLRRRPSATWSPGSTTGTSTTPTCAPSSAGSAASPRARCRSTCAARPYLLDARRHRRPRAARPRTWAPPRCACRAASTPTSTATTTSTSPGR